MDITFVRNILQALGPVEVSDYNEKVDANNLYLLTQKHAEKNFFPGSTQKKDFLRSLFLAIENNFLSGENRTYDKIIQAVEKSIEEKHLLFSFSNQSTQNVFLVNHLSSSLLDTSSGSNTISDFLGVNEANLGINKANYFIKRKIKQSILINHDSIFSKLELSYYNGSNAWPGGDYKVYERIIVPLNSELSSIKINGQSQDIVPAVTDFLLYESKDFTPPKGLEVEQYNQEGKTIFGFLTTIEKNKTQKIVITYHLPFQNTQNSFLYNFSVFKQPGTEEYPFEISLSHDSSLSSFLIPPGFIKSGNIITASTVLRKDEQYLFGFQKPSN